MVEAMNRGRHQISNGRVLEALKKVPRHRFVPDELSSDAYADRPLPIGHGQTISQPYIVAFMTEQLDPKPGQKVLEVGSGCGYQTAVLAQLVERVYSIEIVEALAARAKETLRGLGYDNISLATGDGFRGWPEHAPFDAIIVTCAPTEIPRPLIDQLAEGGRMIIPVGAEGERQQLHLLTKKDGELHRKAVLPVRFVPMTGEAGQD